MKTMSNESLKSHIESITKQISELGDVKTSAFEGGYSTVQNISKSLIQLKTLYEKELKSRKL